MKKLSITGIYKYKNKIYTENPIHCKGFTVYDEKILNYNNKEYRSWNPYKSKLSAAIHNGLKKLDLSEKSNILYLGAATGTTVSHLADIVKKGTIYTGIEFVGDDEKKSQFAKHLKKAHRMFHDSSSLSVGV